MSGDAPLDRRGGPRPGRLFRRGTYCLGVEKLLGIEDQIPDRATLTHHPLTGGRRSRSACRRVELAVTTGFPPERIVLHGNAKSPRDLKTALRLNVGRIVIDSPSELARLAAAVGPYGHQKVMVLVAPGVSAGAHDKIRTGTDNLKFSLTLTDGYAQHAIARVLDQPQLELTGLHCHLGSRISTAKPYLIAVRRLIGLWTRVPDQHGPVLPELDLGGGHGIVHRPGEPALDLPALARRVRAELTSACTTADLPVPRPLIEPGRAIAGPAGIALYRVVAVKRTAEHVFVAVDGGMSDTAAPHPLRRPGTPLASSAGAPGPHPPA